MTGDLTAAPIPRARAMRVLFATTAGAGHFGPLEPFASACLRAGRQVLVTGQAGGARTVARAGLPFRPLGEPAAEDVARFRAGQEGLSSMEAMARAAGGLYVRLYGGAALPGMLDAIRDWRPDVVVRESAEFSSLVAADRLGVPHAQVTVGLSSGLVERMLALVATPLDELRARPELPLDQGRRTARLQLTLSPASLDDPAGAPGPLQRFRPSASATPGPRPGDWGDPSTPLVYVSFGTEAPSPSRPYFPDLYRQVVRALADLPVRVLVTVSDHRDPGELGPVPPSVRVRRWAPNAAVLRQAAVMIGHGGAGSVLGALTAGVPMALVPLFADQPLNARRVAALGAGIALDSGPELAAGLGPAVIELLSDPRYRLRAREIADEIAALPPVDHAVGALEALIDAGRDA